MLTKELLFLFSIKLTSFLKKHDIIWQVLLRFRAQYKLQGKSPIMYSTLSKYGDIIQALPPPILPKAPHWHQSITWIVMTQLCDVCICHLALIINYLHRFTPTRAHTSDFSEIFIPDPDNIQHTTIMHTSTLVDIWCVSCAGINHQGRWVYHRGATRMHLNPTGLSLVFDQMIV